MPNVFQVLRRFIAFPDKNEAYVSVGILDMTRKMRNV